MSLKISESGSVGIVETQYVTFNEKIMLESGIEFGPITVAYETYGKLNENKDNAILVLHALSGDAHAAGYHSAEDKKPGWWDDMIGPNKAFDTEKYFVISSNFLGGCKGTTGPGSINPETGKPYGLSFPVITIEDMVKVQKKLIDHLGITSLASVAGGSMGGMQAIEWAINYPDIVRSVMIIASTSRLSAQGIAFNAVGRSAIISDPNFKNGDYYGDEPPANGLSIARMVAHITYLSEESMHNKFGRRLQRDMSPLQNKFQTFTPPPPPSPGRGEDTCVGASPLHQTPNNFEKKSQNKFEFDIDFQVESYLQHQGQSFVDRFDANSYLYITKAMDYFDVAQKYGSLVHALSHAKSRFLILSFSSDWLFPVEQSKEIVKPLMRLDKEVTYLEIESPYGHDAFLLEYEQQTRVVKSFLRGAE